VAAIPAGISDVQRGLVVQKVVRRGVDSPVASEQPGGCEHDSQLQSSALFQPPADSTHQAQAAALTAAQSLMRVVSNRAFYCD
jgi:NADPH:quinone reductase-like Zn-dependent oxidoreductase